MHGAPMQKDANEQWDGTSTTDMEREKEVTRAMTPPLQANKHNYEKIECMGWVSLACLVIQNTALTLTMRASRLATHKQAQEDYLATSAVVCCEVIKFVMSFLCLIHEKGGWQQAKKAIQKDILDNLSGNLVMIVPSALYTLQNNLQYYAASHLDPATFQVLYQMKLVTTALLSVIMLNRSLSVTQWSSVFILTAGIALVQTADSPTTSSVRTSQLLGFVAVLVACCTSALAGVYIEKLVKQTRPSVWIRNLQLAWFGLVVGLIGSYAKDKDEVLEKGFFVGFEAIVWVVVLLQSFGGLLIAVVLKYADNIVKGFATGLSIIGSALASVYLFNFVLTTQYVTGASIVIVSVYLYTTNNVGPCVACIPCMSSISKSSDIPSPLHKVEMKSQV